MTMRHRLVVLLALLALPGPCADAAAPFVRPEPLKGAIVRGQVLTFEYEASSEDNVWPWSTAWLAPLGGENTPSSARWGSSDEGPPRWHIGHGACWIGFSLSTLAPPSGINDGLDRYELEDFLRGSLLVGPEAKNDPKVFPGWFIGEGALEERRSLGRFCNFAQQINYDYLSVGKGKVLLFLLTNVGGHWVPPPKAKRLSGRTVEMTRKERNNPRWSFIVYSCRAHCNEARGKWEELKWAQEDKITVRFRESFQVLGKGEDYYFVTASGQLYAAKKPAKGKQRTLVKVWFDAARPIEALITDADANRTFLFVGPAKKGGKPAFFELSDRPRLESYDPASVKPGKQGPERLRRVLHYARVLVAHKKVKGAK